MTNDELTQEIMDIAAALTDWLVSQEVSPGMAVAAMCRLIATMCVNVPEGEPMDMANSANQAITGLTLLGMIRRGQ